MGEERGHLSREIGDIKWMEDAGAGAVVLYSLFEEQIGLDADELDHLTSRGAQSLADASGYFPGQLDYTRDPEAYVEHVRKAKEAVDIPVPVTAETRALLSRDPSATVLLAWPSTMSFMTSLSRGVNRSSRCRTARSSPSVQ